MADYMVKAQGLSEDFSIEFSEPFAADPLEVGLPAAAAAELRRLHEELRAAPPAPSWKRLAKHG